MKKVYADTNVFVEYGQAQAHWSQREHAYELFRRGWNCAFHLVVSDWVITEAKRHISMDVINEVLDEFRTKNKLIEVSLSIQEKREAEKYDNWPDARHALVAKRAGADVIATRDKGFYEFREIIPFSLPEGV